MAARTLYKLQARRRLVAGNMANAIDALPGTVAASAVPLRHQLRREALPPPVDEADRTVLQHLAGVLGGSS